MKKIYTIFLFAIISCVANAQYTKLLDFVGANGSYPYGSLISDGTFLYGMTSGGGTNNIGIVFKIKPDGTGYVKLLDFSGIANGSGPGGSLLYDGTFLYGMTNAGGTNTACTNGCGTIFKIKTDGTGYAKLFDFPSSTPGYNPVGTLISDGTFLYGMTNAGGTGGCTGGCGTIFKIKTDGTGYANLLDFNGANGSHPSGSLIYDGTFLYGMTYYDGANGIGVIIKIKPDGTGYAKVLDFGGATNGIFPYGTLISEGAFLYGMTANGGTNSSGNIFKIKPDGTGGVDLCDFYGANGAGPYGSLISDGTFLYGMTFTGGTNSYGVLLKIKLDGTSYSKLLDFAGTANGRYPNGDVFSDGMFLYGMTNQGGANDLGVIFKYQYSAVGIAENNAETGFTISPNPANGAFMLVAEPQTTDIKQIEIYNVLGEKIYSSKINSTKSEIDLSKEPNGIYFLQIKTTEGIANKKIIISK